jgi:hypothetical protein
MEKSYYMNALIKKQLVKTALVNMTLAKNKNSSKKVVDINTKHKNKKG